MDESEPSCALCAVKKRKCSAKAEPTIRCTECTPRGRQASIKEARPFPFSDIQRALYLQVSLGTLLTFAGGTDPHACRVEISSVSQGKTYQKTEIQFETNGHFVSYDETMKPTWNEAMASAFDEGIRRSLSVKLRAKGEYQLIPQAVLAGGYAKLRWSTIETTEQVITFRDGQIGHNDSEDHSLAALLRNFFSYRLGELVEEVMVAVRFQDVMDGFPDYCSHAYAAAVILVRELNFFRNNTPGLSGYFKEWLTSVKTELLQYIKQGCQKHRQWHSPIIGSMKEARRQPELLTMAIHVHKSTSKLPDLEIGESPSSPASFGSQTPSIADQLFDDPLYEFDFSFPSNPSLNAASLAGQFHFENRETPLYSKLLDPKIPILSVQSLDDFPLQDISLPPIAKTNAASFMSQSQVPLMDISGQVPYHSSLSADYPLPVQDESDMASLDPRILSTERQRLRAGYVPSNSWA